VLLGDRPEVEQADQAEADGRAVGDADADAPPGQHGEGQAHAAAVAEEPPHIAPVPVGVGVGQGEAADAGDGVAPEPGEHQPDPQDVVDAGGDHARHQADQGPLAPGRTAQAEQGHDGDGRDDGVPEPVGQRHHPGERDPQRGDGREPQGQVEHPREQRRVGEQHPDRGQQPGVLGRRPPRRPAQRPGRRDRRLLPLPGLVMLGGWRRLADRPRPLGPLWALGRPWHGRLRPLDVQPGDGHVRLLLRRGSRFTSPTENPSGPSPIPTGCPPVRVPQARS
jgi:hypothetical protein